MYIPSYYRNNDLTEIKSFIRKNSFALLITCGEEKPEATHIPIELVEAGPEKFYLQGHVSRANPQWKSFSENNSVLAVFQGPHTYVSSSWYNHVNVPTRNYMAVHVYGKIKIIDGKWKLSQNRDKENHQNIIRELEKLKDLNAKLIAKEMIKQGRAE